MKDCTKCGESKPLQEYRQNSRSQDGRENICKRCRGRTDRRQKLKKRYGITLEHYKTIAHSQRNLCAICHRPPPLGERLEVDHDHDTGSIRGLLCGKCNRAIGLLEEHPAILTLAIDYLNRHRDTPDDDDDL